MLPRLKPDPTPAIHPVPEHRADGALKGVYEDTKAVLGVPWMGVVAMAFAHYPTFYRTLWSGIRDVMGEGEVAGLCRDLRRLAQDRVGELGPRPIAGELAAMGYGPREIDEIRSVVEIFSAGNQPYLLMASLARRLLEAGDPSEPAAPAATAGPADAGVPNPAPAPPETGVRAVAARLVLMEPHHADAPTRAVYEDLKSVLGLPFVNTDYRALARWPSYFALAWSRLGPVAGTARHEAIATALHEHCLARVDAAPLAGRIRSVDLVKAAEADAPAGEVVSVVRLFQWLLPGLVTNVAFLRAELGPGRGL